MLVIYLNTHGLCVEGCFEVAVLGVATGAGLLSNADNENIATGAAGVGARVEGFSCFSFTVTAGVGTGSSDICQGRG